MFIFSFIYNSLILDYEAAHVWIVKTAAVIQINEGYILWEISQEK